ncbi:MAG: respiratory nitrate reductase subunit gamma [Desulfobacteraceae bacterium]|nr:nitrate reductase [Desulfobacteraceae bacterium]MBC2755297.1 respiratory nitrate reductase subunit gamma [Desulfobacteraceae bacterium]
MHDLFSFVRGPMVWIAFTVFTVGSLYRLISMWRLAKKKDSVIFNYFSIFFAIRSIGHWILPFAGVNMRKHPAMTVVAFLFHGCLFAVPIFLSAHVILFKESWNISWWWMPDMAADIMAMIVIGCCLFFLGRRIFLKEVRYLTSVSDYLILAAVAVPFISGVWAYHQWAAFQAALVIHIVSGEIMLMIIPFTKLSHMLFAPFTRGYMGSEFGGVRNSKDW